MCLSLVLRWRLLVRVAPFLLESPFTLCPPPPTTTILVISTTCTVQSSSLMMLQRRGKVRRGRTRPSISTYATNPHDPRTEGDSDYLSRALTSTLTTPECTINSRDTGRVELVFFLGDCKTNCYQTFVGCWSFSLY